MHTDAKINFKKYLILSIGLLSISMSLMRTRSELYGSVGIFIAACLNQVMLVAAVRSASKTAITGEQTNKFKMLFLILGKMLLLLGALSFGVQIMGDRVLIPLLIYVLQIAVLYLSFNKSR